jgi:hypothetical protein
VQSLFILDLFYPFYRSSPVGARILIGRAHAAARETCSLLQHVRSVRRSADTQMTTAGRLNVEPGEQVPRRPRSNLRAREQGRDVKQRKGTLPFDAKHASRRAAACPKRRRHPPPAFPRALPPRPWCPLTPWTRLNFTSLPGVSETRLPHAQRPCTRTAQVY